jgi:hypothetical protein
MLRRPHVYRDGLRGVLTDDGRFAPGVTSILKRGLPTPESLARWKYTHPQAAEITQRAATRGTALHAAIESWLRGEAADATHLTPADIRAVEEFATVFGDHHVLEVEENVLVDDGDLLYSGSADHVFVPTTDLQCVTGEIIPAGAAVVGDLKTSKAVYESYHAQLAAYAHGLGCEHAVVWHFTPSGVNLHWINLAAGWRVFIAAYTLAHELPALEARAQRTKSTASTAARAEIATGDRHLVRRRRRE